MQYMEIVNGVVKMEGLDVEATLQHCIDCDNDLRELLHNPDDATYERILRGKIESARSSRSHFPESYDKYAHRELIYRYILSEILGIKRWGKMGARNKLSLLD